MDSSKTGLQRQLVVSDAIVEHTTMTEKQQPYAPRAGDTVRVIGMSETFGVVDTTDPALVTLRNQNGKEFRVGWRVLEEVQSAA